MTLLFWTYFLGLHPASRPPRKRQDRICGQYLSTSRPNRQFWQFGLFFFRPTIQIAAQLLYSSKTRKWDRRAPIFSIKAIPFGQNYTIWDRTLHFDPAAALLGRAVSVHSCCSGRRCIQTHPRRPYRPSSNIHFSRRGGAANR